MNTADRWRVAIFSGLLVIAAGLVGAFVWWGLPFLKSWRDVSQWKDQMREVSAHRAQIEADWTRLFGPLEEFPKRHPATIDNEAAHKLDMELAGMDMNGIIRSDPLVTMADVEEAIRPDREQEFHTVPHDPIADAEQRANVEIGSRRSDAARLVTTYLSTQVERPDDVIAAPDPKLADYLHTQSAGLARIRALLTDGEMPVWRADYSHADVPIVNLLAFLQLNRLLAVEGFASIRSLDSQTALDDVRAMAALNRALAARPEVVSLLVSITSERFRHALTRAISTPPPIEITESNPLSWRSAMHEAIAGEVWNASSILKESLDQQRSKTRAHAVSGKLPPRDDAEYQAFCRLDYQRAVTKAIQSIETRDLCSLSAVDQPEMKPATWNLTANIAMPNLSSLSRRVQRLEMESEMTRKVVQLVQARAVAVTGELKLPAGFAASGCKTGHWLVEKSADGQSVTLRFSAPIDWGEKMKGAKIPLQFTLHDSPQPASPPQQR